MFFLTGTFLVTLATLVVLLLLYSKWIHTYWQRKGVPTIPSNFLFGSAKKLLLRGDTIGEGIAKVYHEYKAKGHKYCGMYLGFQTQWILLDPELIKTIMTKDFMHFTDHGNYINEKNDPLTGQLFMLKGAKWKNMRIKLTPTFTSGKMKMMFPTLLDCSKELIAIMDDTAETGEGVDIKDIVARYTTDVIGSCAFGIECNTLKNPDSEFRYYGKKVFHADTLAAIKNMIASTFPSIMDVLRIPLFHSDVIEFFTRIVTDTVDYREKNNVFRKDFMHLLIQLKNNVKLTDGDENLKSNEKKSGALTMNEVIAQAFVFFLAGFETSSTTLTFCFFELVSNLEIQEKMREEINRVIEKHGELTYDSLTEMTYAEKCINETLRKYPPLPLLMRECTQDYRVPGSDLTIEYGTKVFIPTLGMQRDPEYYPDPEKFDPERFSPENKAERHPFTWLPFGEGPRVCIGLRFGMMQTKVALAILLRRYRFTLNSKTVTPLVLDPKSFIMAVKDGIWLNVERI